jgi:acetyl-CoA synthetase
VARNVEDGYQMTGVRKREIDPDVKSYDELRASFRWHVPEQYNIAEDICDRHAANPETADRVALYHEDASGNERTYTFSDFKRLSDRLARLLRQLGIERGDRVAVLLPQVPETIISHLAIYKLGAIVVPLTVLFRQDALLHRLYDSGSKILIMQPSSMSVVEPLLPGLPELNTLLLTDPTPVKPAWTGAVVSFWDGINSEIDGFVPADTSATDPAVIIYTSGTTGNPKGALHAHRFLLGHLPAVELSHTFFPQPDDLFWTPADWSWIGGLINALFSSLHHAVPVVGCETTGRFAPEAAFSLMEKYGVRNAFLPPTALRMMAQVPDVPSRYDLKLRSIMSGGESLGAHTLDWARDVLGVEINEIYGQTEINLVIGNCAALWNIRPGSMGRVYPGHEVAILDDEGNLLQPGQIGEVAVRVGDDPVFFLKYWNNPEATVEKFSSEWARLGDLALQDDAGYFWFKGRKDDVIITAGHRIGPTEVENALMRHPAVAMAAVVASPDELRGDVIKAFIKLTPGQDPTDELASSIQEFVKDTLARHEYPRKIEFVDDLPLTPTGKIRRNVLREREADSQ